MAIPGSRQHLFSQIPHADVPRSSFNRSHGYKTTFDSGYLVPFYVDEALPGDTFNCNATLFARLATPAVPVMDNMRLTTFYFAVPYRLVWNHFQAFMGEQEEPDSSTDFLIPQIDSGEDGFEVGSLSDYFGIPTGVSDLSCSVLFHRAYNLIWNEWFRDQNLQDRVPVPKDDGPDPVENYKLLRRCKKHDYFTSSLPWPQKGPGAEIPIGTYAPVVYGDVVNPVSDSATATGKIAQFSPSRTATTGRAVSSNFYLNDPGSPTEFFAVGSDQAVSLVTDLSQAGSVTINALRTSVAFQHLMERQALGGSRYTEIIRSMFGVVSPDARLQRPEYLGGSSGMIYVKPVEQTSSTDSTTPQGNLAAIGTYVGENHGFQKSFVEHTLIIGLVHVGADLTYQQGLNRMFSRRTKLDFYWPALAHLGEQAVLNKEIYAQGSSVLNNVNTPVDEDVFGYQERNAEYRYYPSQITGKFRSTYATSLDVWHLAQKFDTLPTLSASFIEDNPPIKRIIAVQDEPEFLLDSLINLRCVRPMPLYSVPGLNRL